MFVSYQKVNESEPMFMGNGTASKIEGKGKVILKLTSRKDLDKDKQISNPMKRVLDDELYQDQRDNTSGVPQENAEPRSVHYQRIRQREGQDFFDTYSPVTRINSIRTLIAIAAIHNLIIHQMDVKNAFLNGELDEEIYMQQPEGFVVKGQEPKFSGEMQESDKKQRKKYLKCSIPINKGLIQAIPTSLPLQPIGGGGTKAATFEKFHLCGVSVTNERDKALNVLAYVML
ncbi:retrotransposon protein, putative, ty1-copia subclass [Tanacetum coccineum]